MSVAALLAEIAEIGRDPRGGYARHLFDPSDLALRAWFEDRAIERGLRLDPDGNGNLWAWWDAGAGPAIATGSHLDSVPGGGALDGPLGIVCALDAVERLRADGFDPARPIAVVVFAEEEGSRFGIPCLGSRLMTGTLRPGALAERVDAEGVRFSEAWASGTGRTAPDGEDDSRIAGLGAFVELHVEQGRDLEDRGLPIAVGTGILAHGRWRATVAGEGNHAGTTPLRDRHDPAVVAAGAVLAVRTLARSAGARGTVGRIRLTPGGTNVIASVAELWIDLRAPRDDEVRALHARLAGELSDLAAAEGCTLELVEESFSPEVLFDTALTARIDATLGGVPAIPTGAGHDAGILAARIPTAMLFVRNPTGVSHAPGESARDEDAEAGAAALAAVLRDLAGAG